MTKQGKQQVARKTLRARRLGKQLRKLRKGAGLNQEQLCAAIDPTQQLTQGQLSKIEAGSARVADEQLDRIIAAVQADDSTATHLHQLRARAEEPGWWSPYSPYIHETLEMAVELGEDAQTIRTYDAGVVQGLLQTEEYARTIIESSRAWVRPTDVEMLVELRMRRQDRLTEPEFGGLTAVLTEAALYHQVGTPTVMRTQLNRLIKITEEGIAAVHVLPYDQGPWPGLGGFAIFSFPDEHDSEVVQVDGDLGAGIYEDREPVAALTYTFNAALAKAKPARESLDLVNNAIKDLDRKS